MPRIEVYQTLDEKMGGLIKECMQDLPKKPQSLTEQYLLDLPAHFSNVEKIKKLRDSLALSIPPKDIASQIEIGDSILFMSGFFPEHLTKKGDAHAKYFTAVGKKAYGGAASLLHQEIKSVCEMYHELSDQFESYACLFHEVRYKIQEKWNEKELVNLWGEYLKTKDKHAKNILLKNGMIPTT